MPLKRSMTIESKRLSTNLKSTLLHSLFLSCNKSEFTSRGVYTTVFEMNHFRIFFERKSWFSNWLIVGQVLLFREGINYIPHLMSGLYKLRLLIVS